MGKRRVGVGESLVFSACSGTQVWYPVKRALSLPHGGSDESCVGEFGIDGTERSGPLIWGL